MLKEIQTFIVYVDFHEKSSDNSYEERRYNFKNNFKDKKNYKLIENLQPKINFDSLSKRYQDYAKHLEMVEDFTTRKVNEIIKYFELISQDKKYFYEITYNSGEHNQFNEISYRSDLFDESFFKKIDGDISELSDKLERYI